MLLGELSVFTSTSSIEHCEFGLLRHTFLGAILPSVILAFLAFRSNREEADFLVLR
jgi:hypothetical protein